MSAVTDEWGKGTIVRITVEMDYVIPEYESNVDGTIEEWFGKKYPLSQRHAYRDSSLVAGNNILDVKKITYDEFVKSIQKRLKGRLRR